MGEFEVGLVFGGAAGFAASLLAWAAASWFRRRRAAAGYIYLASPYSHSSARVRRERAAAAAAYVRKNVARGERVFSPIVHGVGVVGPVGGRDGSWETWRALDEALLRGAAEVRVLAIDGHDRSEGIAAEVALARRIGIKVRVAIPAELEM